ncbi:MAG: DUF1080 domain-containing protein [Chryseolinea sp.]
MEQNIKMMRRYLVFFLIVFVVFLGCKTAQKSQTSTSGWRPLMNGKDLTGWDTYLGAVFDTLTEKQVGAPLGINTDPRKTFSIVTVDNKPALRISGEDFGGISTQNEFSNYHLRLAFKWGKLKWAPRKNAKRDSGLLYHGVGPHGAGYGSWLRSQEFQVQEGDCGDYWTIAESIVDIPATEIKAGEFRFDPAAPLQTFGEGKAGGKRCFKYPDAEKPYGEWNVLEVYCFGDTSVHVVNGKTVMTLFHSRQPGDDGKDMPLKKGKIQLQSEGAEVFYRDIEIMSITRLPETLLLKN